MIKKLSAKLLVLSLALLAFLYAASAHAQTNYVNIDDAIDTYNSTGAKVLGALVTIALGFIVYRWLSKLGGRN
jgi:hypothetical protein